MVDFGTFARAVRDMRRAQAMASRTRDATWLLGARQREAEVDRMLRETDAGDDLFERAARARACAGELAPSALRANDEVRVTSDEREAAR